MTSPAFGIVLNEQDTDALVPVLADLSTIGLVLPSQGANPVVFPLNLAVSVNSGDPTVLAAMGTGPLYNAVARINAQLADLQVSAQIVVVRVPMAFNADGTENVAGTIANIVGDPAAVTGLYALLKAPQLCNVTPRLLGAPGYTGYTALALQALAIAAQGHDYLHPIVTFAPPGATAIVTVGNAGVQAAAHAVLANGGVGSVLIDNGGQDYADGAPAVSFSGGGGAGAVAHAVVANGIVTGIVVDQPGTGYTSAPAVTLSAPAPGEITGVAITNPGSYPPGTVVVATISDSQGGQGAGATLAVTLQQLTNPVCAAFPAIAAKLLAHYIVGGPGGSKQDALNWRKTLPADKRCIAQDDWEIVAAGQGTVYVDGAARSLGLAVRIDYQHKGFPFYSWANTQVQGALGLKRYDSYSLTDGDTDGQQLLAAGIGVTVRGDLSDTSLDDSGFTAVSYSNCNGDTNLNFYNKTRGRDFTDLALIKTIRKFLGKNNITTHAVQSVLNTMSSIMGQMPRDGVVGYKIGFNKVDNSVAGLRAGKFTVYDNSEEAAPITVITIDRALDQDALTAELTSLAATTTGAAGS